MTDELAAAAVRFADNPAIIDGNRSLSYRDYYHRSLAAASVLENNGVQAGDRVAIKASTSWRVPILLQAIWHIGATAVPISDRFPPEMVERLIDRTACRCLVCNGPSGVQSTGQPYPALNLMDIVRDGDDDHGPVGVPATRADDGPATIMFTSGSSGDPKGVCHTLSQHHYSAAASNGNIKLLPTDRWLVALPLFHVGGLSVLFRAQLAGAAVVMPEHGASLAKVIATDRVTHMSLVATQLARLLDSDPDEDTMAGVRAILVGGSAIPASLITTVHERGWPLFSTYGSTEMASQITTTLPGDSLQRLLTSGRSLSHCELSFSECDEIMVRGVSLCLGYWQGRAIVSATDDNGWYRTGDIGSLDQEGYLSVRGRIDRMFVSGGENVHPEQIEKALTSLPEIEAACVVPVDDAEFGQRPIAVLSFGPHPKASPIGLAERLLAGLPGYMIPVRFYRWPVEVSPGGLKDASEEMARLVAECDLEELT